MDWPGFHRLSRLTRCLLTGVGGGLAVAAVLSFWFTSHPMLHSEFETPEGRAILLPRVLRVAPWLMVVPVVAGALAGLVRHRRGSEGFPKLPWRTARHLVFVTALLWTAEALVLWAFVRLLRSS
jgi:hypothetical protein